MNDQEADPKEEYKDSQEVAEELAKKKLKEMFAGFKDLVAEMGEIAKNLKAIQVRHANALAQVGVKPTLTTSEHRLEARVDAILDLTSALASAQIVSMEMGQKQLDLTMRQLNDLVDLD